MDRPVVSRNCPRCLVELAQVEVEGFRVMHCGRCGGHLASAEQMKFIERLDRTAQDELKAEAMAGFTGAHEARILCPRCHGPMRTEPVRLPGLTIRIDVCHACPLVWLDGGELALVQLGREAGAGHADAREMRRRHARLESDPERKAAFEADLRELEDVTTPAEEAIVKPAGEFLLLLMRFLSRRS